MLNVFASMGVVIYSKSGNNEDLLIRQADQAMYIAKESGKNRYHFFDAHTNVDTITLYKNMDEVH